MPTTSPNLRRVFSSSVGTKLLIGLTGLALFAYMLLHLAGNLVIFLGRDTFNEYSHVLVSNPLIVPVEIGLLLVFLLHIYKAITMWRRNKQARPVAYEKKERAGHTSRKSLSSSTMIASGLVILVFVIIHVRQFKFGSFYLALGSNSVRDLYRTEIEVFRNPLWVAFYVVATLLVGLHLRHGFSSAFQSLGLDHPRYARYLIGAGIVFAILIGGGLAIIPVWSFFTHY
jgi:succinate dehydrogenase / fumarate reductase, cytochrome b subunit